MTEPKVTDLNVIDLNVTNVTGQYDGPWMECVPGTLAKVSVKVTACDAIASKDLFPKPAEIHNKPLWMGKLRIVI